MADAAELLDKSTEVFNWYCSHTETSLTELDKTADTRDILNNSTEVFNWYNSYTETSSTQNAETGEFCSFEESATLQANTVSSNQQKGNGPFTSTPMKSGRAEYASINDFEVELEEGDLSLASALEVSENELSLDVDSHCQVHSVFKTEYSALKCPSSRLHRKALDSENIRNVVNPDNWCQKSCLQSLTTGDVAAARDRFWSKKYPQRMEWMLEKVDTTESSQKTLFFTVKNGSKVCAKCFRLFLNIDKNFYYKCVKKYREGIHASGVLRGRSSDNRTLEAMAWLSNYTACRGDHRPDKREILLSFGTRKRRVYISYKDDMAEQMKVPICLSAFYKMWNDQFPNIKIKQEKMFSRCDTCSALERQMDMTHDTYRRKEIEAEFKAHNDRQMNERLYYYGKREDAKFHSGRLLSLIVDGMDQSKTNLPHFVGTKAKVLSSGDLLKTHITGIINHSSQGFRTFIDINEYSHDSNLVINLLLVTISEYSISKGNKLPPTLYIQADNTCRENKNKYVLAFLELLVKQNIFKMVELSFLYVGHTHEDIDARFSEIADTLRQKSAETLTDLRALLKNNQLVHGLFNVRDWLLPHINDIKGHTKPLHFKFESLGTGVCGFYRKKHDDPWIKMTHTILAEIPTGTPDIIIPQRIHGIEINNIKKVLIKAKPLFSMGKYNEMNRLLDNISTLQKDQQALKTYAERGAQWLLPGLPKQLNQPTPQVTLPDGLRSNLDQEVYAPQLEIKSKKKKASK